MTEMATRVMERGMAASTAGYIMVEYFIVATMAIAVILAVQPNFRARVTAMMNNARNLWTGTQASGGATVDTLMPAAR